MAGLGLGLVQDLSLIRLGRIPSRVDDSPFLMLEDLLLGAITEKKQKKQGFLQ